MPILKVRLSDQVFTEIKRIIAEEEFSPGDRFYSENALTKRLNVSRSSIREAIRLLEVSGFVHVYHGKGIFIDNPDRSGQEAFEHWLRDNEQELNEHFEIRLIIDPKAAATAAKRADRQDVERLEAICREFRRLSETGTTADLIKVDEQFHLQLAKATKNRTLYMIMKTMTQSLPEGWISSLHVPGRIEKTVTEHCEIVEAIEAGDSSLAEQRMEAHLSNALRDIRAFLQEEQGGPR